MPDEVQSLFTRLFRRYAGELRAKLDKDITGPQLGLLELLRMGGPQKMTDLADNLCVTVGAVTLLGDRLIKHGLVERERLQSDRRVVQLSITQGGLELVGQYSLVRNEVLETYLGRLTADEVEQLTHLYKKMLDIKEDGTK